MKNLFLILLCLTMIACGVNALIKKEYTYDKRFVKGEGYYNKEGKKEGVWKEYRFNDNGVFRKEFEALYGNGERMTFIGSYLNGEKEGIWKEFYESDQLFQEGNFTEGEKHGEWQIWDERGIKRYFMNYANGTKVGTWIMWDDKGQIINKKEY